MKDNFCINFDWLYRDHGNAIERATLAEVAITANRFSLFELEDFTTKSVRKSARVSAYNLAMWFATNYWKLLYEPRRVTLDWEMSHRIGAAGGGYLWPNVTFASDGATMAVQSEAALFPKSGEPIRYINNFNTIVSAEEFQNKISFFMESVIARLVYVGVDAPQLVGLWKDICAERQDWALSRWRKLEAIMGFDPDEAPENLITGVNHAADNYGTSAVEEVAAASQERVLDHIKDLYGAPRAESAVLHIPSFETLREEIGGIKPTLFPWEKAEEAARIARRAWSVDQGPITTNYLSDILGFPHDLIEQPSKTKGPMSAGFRADGVLGTFNAFLTTRHPANRRFALMRLVGDNLTASFEDSLLPASDIKTYRQKFQRAFAQEFLCPYGVLKEFLGSNALNDDSIEDAAQYFNVSPLLVTSVLVNKGEINRENLDGYDRAA